MRSVSFTRTWRALGPFIALLLTLSVIPASGHAQDTVTDLPTLLILAGDGTPAGVFYAEIEPGARGQVEIGLAVDADEPIDVTAAIANAVSPPNGGFSPAPANEPLTEPATWLDLDTSPLTLETGETVARTVEIAVPANTEPGQYVAALALTATEPMPIAGTEGVEQLARATAAIAITVPGDFEAGFGLGEPAFIQTGTGGVIQIPVENTGTVPVYPQGTLTIESPDGEAAAALPVTMGAVFAGTSTVVEVTLGDGPPPGDYRFALALTDANTGATANLPDSPLVVPEPPPGSGDPEPFDPSADGASVTFERIAIEPQGTPLESVQVTVEVANVGNPVPSATLTLEVSRNGALAEEVVVADGVSLADGVTGFTTSYAPEGGYGSGLWSFRIRLDAIAADGDATLLIQTGTVAKIDVP